MSVGDSDWVVQEVRDRNQSRQVLFVDVLTFAGSDPSGEIAVACQWTTGTTDEIPSLVNGIATPAGGMHVEGFKRSLTAVINKCARAHVADPLRDTLLGSDLREGLTAAISVTMEDPEFGPMGRFENLGIRRLVERATTEQVEQWISRNPNQAELIIQKAMAARRWREDR